MNKRTVLPFLALGLTSSAFALTSTFDTGADGWTTFNIAGGVTWSVTGGNPDGHISAADDQSGWGYFKAPASYTAQPAVYGSNFTFDMKHTSSTGAPTLYKVRVAIEGAGLVLIKETVLPTSQWLSYSFGLTETSGWRKFSTINQNYSTGAPMPSLAEMQSVLGGMTGLYIAADYNDETTPPRDVTYLDNVGLEAVPEPGTMMALALGAVALLRRRR